MSLNNNFYFPKPSDECTVILQETIRFAAVGDIHCKKESAGSVRKFFLQAAAAADALLLCGDLTHHGLPEEAHVFAEELSAVRIPIVAVLGNHDFESGKEGEVRRILTEAGVRVLDGEVCDIHGVGIAGAKGFSGGYGQRMHSHSGERAAKQFVDEALHEARKLESALAKLRTRQRIALLHYSPIKATLEGEPVEIYPFLGTSRIEEPLIRYPVNVVFHGHAHRGFPEGKTANGISVYNVAKPLLQSAYPDRPPFRVIEIQKSELGEPLDQW